MLPSPGLNVQIANVLEKVKSLGFGTQLSIIGSSAVLFYIIKSRLNVPTLPKIEYKWWGPGQAKKEDTSITPFKIEITDDVLKDLEERLNNARPFVPPLDGVQQNYGMNTNLLKEIVEFWKNQYNWREREKFLNQFPQYTTNIQGLKIHYIHVKPQNTNGLKVLPLALFHGWPGSVREFYEMIPILTTPQKGRNFVFEVIAPSLPGYGFSEGASKPGLSVTNVAILFQNLMGRLGFDKYYIQGGDWGSAIVQTMGVLFPQNILGVHSNFCFMNSGKSNLKLILCSMFPRLIVDKKHEHLVYPLGKIFKNLMLESGYMHIQATKPDTVGVALNDSPVGLAAYILEKFTTWTNPEWKNLEDGGLKNKFTYTKLLDNVMIYWVTKSITTSIRLYAESLSSKQGSTRINKLPLKVPSACVRFSNELAYSPTTNIKEKFVNLIHLSDYDDVGHFAAFEAPDILAKDIYDAIEKIEKLYSNK